MIFRGVEIEGYTNTNIKGLQLSFTLYQLPSQP